MLINIGKMMVDKFKIKDSNYKLLVIILQSDRKKTLQLMMSQGEFLCDY